MQSIPYNNDKARCPGCGGMLAYDATMTQKLPLGLGFAGPSGKFQIDFVLREGFRGECMKCGKVVFAVRSEKRKTTYPAGINRKLEQARKAQA